MCSRIVEHVDFPMSFTRTFLTVACKCVCVWGGGGFSGGPIWFMTLIPLTLLDDQLIIIANHMHSYMPSPMSSPCHLLCPPYASLYPSYAPCIPYPLLLPYVPFLCNHHASHGPSYVPCPKFPSMPPSVPLPSKAKIPKLQQPERLKE